MRRFFSLVDNQNRPKDCHDCVAGYNGNNHISALFFTLIIIEVKPCHASENALNTVNKPEETNLEHIEYHRNWGDENLQDLFNQSIQKRRKPTSQARNLCCCHRASLLFLLFSVILSNNKHKCLMKLSNFL